MSLRSEGIVAIPHCSTSPDLGRRSSVNDARHRHNECLLAVRVVHDINSQEPLSFVGAQLGLLDRRWLRRRMSGASWLRKCSATCLVSHPRNVCRHFFKHEVHFGDRAWHGLIESKEVAL
jgi:hypothetical protein